MSYKYAQLNIQDSHHCSKTGEILIQPGDNAEESDLYILVEIDSNTPEDKQFIEQLFKITFSIYEKTKLFEVEKSLEKILHELNQNLPALLPKKKDYLDKLNCFIGLYQEGLLTFTAFGKINVYQIKQTGIKKINEQTFKKNLNKLFDFTLSGKIKDNEKALITTESLTDYISLEKIKKTVTALPPLSSVAHFTNILEATPSHVSFFSIILTGPQITEDAQKQLPKEVTKLSVSLNSKTSLDQLLSIKDETERILNKPSLLQSLKNRPAIKSIKPTKKITISWNKFFTVSKSLKQIFGFLKFTLQAIILSEARKKLSANLQQKFLQLIKKVNQLPKFNRTLLLIMLILALLLTQNLIYQSKKRNDVLFQQRYNELVQQIESKQSSIEASLIYNDLTRAKQLLEEIYRLLDDLPQNTKNQLAQKETLVKSTDEFSARVWKIINIIEPTVLFDFRQINLGAQITAIAIKDDYLYAVNSTKQPFLYNLKNGQTKILDSFNQNLKHLKSGLNNLLLGDTDEKKIFNFNDGQFSELNVAAIDLVSQIDDLTFYLDKMYILDSKAKQIVRFTYYGSDFKARQSWVKEDLPLNNAISLAVDGYAYALLNNGEILKLSSGKKQEFPQIIVEPKLSAPTKIFTTAESDYLYVLDPQNNRFLIVNKNNGELKNQYRSEKFSELKDFLINEKERKVYLLNGSSVLVIGL